MSTKEKTPDYLKNNDDGSLDITLASAAIVAGAKTPVLRMREPTVGDMEAASQSNGSNATTEIALFANLCGLAPDDVRGMSMRNYNRLQAAYRVFMI